jgi:hypothetical protein
MLPAHRNFAIIWLIFTVLFSTLAGFHWYLSRQFAPDLDVAQRPLSGVGSVQILGADIDKPLREFAAHFNEYVHSQNAASHLENLLAMGGYLLAAFASIVSFFLEVVTIQEKNRAIADDRAAET